VTARQAGRSEKPFLELVLFFGWLLGYVFVVVYVRHLAGFLRCLSLPVGSNAVCMCKTAIFVLTIYENPIEAHVTTDANGLIADYVYECR